jgi:acylphosphatase
MNLPDGSVAGCFEGEEADVNTLVAWCRRGPDWSRVEDVMATTGEYRGEFYDFTIRR